MFDVSEANSGQPFDTLSDALDYADSVLLDSQKKGGMTIKYVQSSDNKYVQYRLLSQTFSTNEADWQGVDSEPKEYSKNLIDSTGTKKALIDYEWGTPWDKIPEYVGWNRGTSGNEHFEISNRPNARYKVIPLNGGETIVVNRASGGTPTVQVVKSYDFPSDNDTYDFATGMSSVEVSTPGQDYTINVPSDGKYVIITSTSHSGSVVALNKFIIDNNDVVKGVYGCYSKPIDNKPVENSTYVISSGGVYDSLDIINNDLINSSLKVGEYVTQDFFLNQYRSNGTGSIANASGWLTTKLYNIKQSYTYKWTLDSDYHVNYILLYDDNGFLDVYNPVSDTVSAQNLLTSYPGAKYVTFNVYKTNSSELTEDDVANWYLRISELGAGISGTLIEDNTIELSKISTDAIDESPMKSSQKFVRSGGVDSTISRIVTKAVGLGDSIFLDLSKSTNYNKFLNYVQFCQIVNPQEGYEYCIYAIINNSSNDHKVYIRKYPQDDYSQAVDIYNGTISGGSIVELSLANNLKIRIQLDWTILNDIAVNCKLVFSDYCYRSDDNITMYRQLQKVNNDFYTFKNKVLGMDTNKIVFDATENAESRITSLFDDTHTATLAFKYKRNAIDINPCFNFEYLILTNIQNKAQTVVDYQTDDITPAYYNTSYMGGNHGCSDVQAVTVTSHGKDYSDIGSIWSNGSNNFTIIGIIDSNTLLCLGENTAVYPLWNFAKMENGDTLTHISGATHTNSMSVSGVSAQQLKPAEKVIDKHLILDGDEIVEHGTYTFAQMKIEEVYEIYNPASVLAIIQSNVGNYTSNPIYNDLGADVNAIHSLVYIFDSATDVKVITSFTAMQYMSASFGFMQKGVMQGQQMKMYIPKTKSITISGNTYDFASIENYNSLTSNVSITKTDWVSENDAPDRFMEFDENIGVCGGILFDCGIYQDRKNLVSTAIRLASTRKVYPYGFEGKILNAGDSYFAVNFRKHVSVSNINQSGVLCNLLFEYNNALYLYLDYTSSGYYTIDVPEKYIGGTIYVKEKSDNVKLLTGYASSKIGVMVGTSENTVSYLVMRIDK